MICPHCKDYRYYIHGETEGVWSEDRGEKLNGQRMVHGVRLHQRCCKGCGMVYALTDSQLDEEE